MGNRKHYKWTITVSPSGSYVLTQTLPGNLVLEDAWTLSRAIDTAIQRTPENCMTHITYPSGKIDIYPGKGPRASENTMEKEKNEAKIGEFDFINPKNNILSKRATTDQLHRQVEYLVDLVVDQTEWKKKYDLQQMEIDTLTKERKELNLRIAAQENTYQQQKADLNTFKERVKAYEKKNAEREKEMASVKKAIVEEWQELFQDQSQKLRVANSDLARVRDSLYDTKDEVRYYKKRFQLQCAFTLIMVAVCAGLVLV